MKEGLTAKRLRELVICDPIAGTMVWRERTEPPMQAASWNRRNAGKPVGSMTFNGYRETAIDNEKYLLHRRCSPQGWRGALRLPPKSRQSSLKTAPH